MTCVRNQMLRRVPPRRSPRHRRDTCSMAWRCGSSPPRLVTRHAGVRVVTAGTQGFEIGEGVVGLGPVASRAEREDLEDAGDDPMSSRASGASGGLRDVVARGGCFRRRRGALLHVGFADEGAPPRPQRAEFHPQIRRAALDEAFANLARDVRALQRVLFADAQRLELREQRPVPASESGGPVLEQRGLDAEKERPLGLAQLPEVALDLRGNQISARWRQAIDATLSPRRVGSMA